MQLRKIHSLRCSKNEYSEVFRIKLFQLNTSDYCDRIFWCAKLLQIKKVIIIKYCIINRWLLQNCIQWKLEIVLVLTLLATLIAECCIKMLYWNVALFSSIFCGASKGFIKAFKAFRQLFVAPQRSVKIKIKLIFLFVQDRYGKG